MTFWDTAGRSVASDGADASAGVVGLLFLRAARVQAESGQASLGRSDHSLHLARRELNHDLADLPVPGNKLESCGDRFGHAMLCGPIGPDVTERDTVRVSGSALGRALEDLGAEPSEPTWGRPAARASVPGRG